MSGGQQTDTVLESIRGYSVGATRCSPIVCLSCFVGIPVWFSSCVANRVLTGKQPIISNDPKTDPRATGTPRGHPQVNAFLGIPLFGQDGNVIGMIAVANKPGGYSQADVDYVEPLAATCGNLIEAHWQIEKNKELIDTLEERVVERTRKLEQTNRELEEANRRVVKASAAQLQHFACMSHEIRTPLNCIIGLMSVLQETELNPMQQDSVQMIVSSADLLLTVVNDVLDYSKLETGNVEILHKRVSLQDTLFSIVHSIETKASGKGIAVGTFIDPAVPEIVHTDGQRLQQILFNLLGNAVKFSNPNSRVELHVQLFRDQPKTKGYTCLPEDNDLSESSLPELSVHKDIDAPQPSAAVYESDPGCPMRRRPKRHSKHVADDGCPNPRHSLASPVSVIPSKTISTTTQCARESLCRGQSGAPSCQQIVTSKSGSILRFVVKDYGKGIEKEEMSRIFKPFRQASGETEAVYGGTGLGLAITAKLVHALGGKISVDSIVGKYSEFYVDLPFPDDPADIKSLSSKLSNACAFLICPFDGFCSDAEMAHIRSVFSCYNVALRRFKSMEDMQQTIKCEGALVGNRNYVCITQEDLYRRDAVEYLSTLANTVLITFGPGFSVKETKAHFRCLMHVVPSVLMTTMGVLVDGGRADAHECSSVSSCSKDSSHDNPAQERELLKVLVADDNAINRKVLGRMLMRLGIKDVDMAENGLQAVEREAAKEYDVVLMDMQMPIMDGLEASRLITNRPSGHPIPLVIFVTAHVGQSYELECAKAGGSGFLSKPFSLEEITALFQKVASPSSENRTWR